jgi:hypothetical protein
MRVYFLFAFGEARPRVLLSQQELTNSQSVSQDSDLSEDISFYFVTVMLLIWRPMAPDRRVSHRHPHEYMTSAPMAMSAQP